VGSVDTWTALSHGRKDDLSRASTQMSPEDFVLGEVKPSQSRDTERSSHEVPRTRGPGGWGARRGRAAGLVCDGTGLCLGRG
jgi:hypothetical protein